ALPIFKCITCAMLILLTPAALAQDIASQMQGTWKYLGAWSFVEVDEQGRAYQCRLDRDTNVFFATGNVEADGSILWTPPRFFSLYGEEVTLTNEDRGRSQPEIRGRDRLLSGPPTLWQNGTRLEYDRVRALPTLCVHYRSVAFAEGTPE